MRAIRKTISLIVILFLVGSLIFGVYTFLQLKQGNVENNIVINKVVDIAINKVYDDEEMMEEMGIEESGITKEEAKQITNEILEELDLSNIGIDDIKDMMSNPENAEQILIDNDVNLNNIELIIENYR